jgi:hypothetical protein
MPQATDLHGSGHRGKALLLVRPGEASQYVVAHFLDDVMDFHQPVDSR